MARDFTERLGGEYDLESRGTDFSYALSATGANTVLPSIYKCGVMLVLKGVVLLRGTLYCCTVPNIWVCLFLAKCVCYTDESSVIRNEFASLNLAHSFGIRSECSFREGCP